MDMSLEIKLQNIEQRIFDLSKNMHILEDINNRLCSIQRKMNLNKRVLNVEEACEYLDMAKSVLYKLTSKRVIPFSKPNGKKMFFDREKLEFWLLSDGKK